VQKKMGRPTDNPKNRLIQAKLDENASAMLERYCKYTGCTVSEAVRQAIKRLPSEYEK
jgi:antitoxin component of RelBE/YafQ-DinJ toxin-antitoxin module